MEYQFNLSVIASHWDYLTKGIGITAWVTVASCGIALVFGLLLGILGMAKNPILRWPSRAYIEFFRNTPVLVQIIWIYYAFPILTGINTTPLTSVIIALAFSAASMFAEIFRAGIDGVDAGEVEASRSMGMSYLQSMRHVVLPQAIRLMIPPFTNMIIVFLKYSSLVSVLGVADLTYRAQLLSTTTFRPLEIFTFIAILYYVLSQTLAAGAARLEKRMALY